MALRRHDLLRPPPPAWDVMLRLHPQAAGLPLVADWARLGRPVIVRRRMTGDAADDIPAALPLPPAYGKQRIAFSFPASAGLKALPPITLHEVAQTAPTAWHTVVAALLDLGEALKAPPRVFGALLWEHATGLPYLSATSDLDLLWRVPDARTAAQLIEGLLRIDAGGPVRIDGELELPDGAGVNWRELGNAGSDPDGGVLVKTMDGVAFRPRAGLFDGVAPQP